MKKGIFILTLLILALFSVSCIYAADVNDTLAANEDTGVIELSHEIESANDNLGTSEEQKVTQTDNEEKTGETDDGSFRTLENKIYHASSGDTVYLENNYSCEDSWTDDIGIFIRTSNLVIEGQGHTIDAKQKTRIFYFFNAENVTIKNIKFINAKINDNSGGAILWYEGTNGSVSGCSFVNCSTGNSGGAIWWYDSPYGSVSGCSFVNCSAGDNCGAIEWSHSDYGSVSGCSFVNCSAGLDGGAIDWYVSANGNISDCVFINNTDSNGKAIYMEGSSVSLDRNWFGNTAENYETSPNAYIYGAVPDNWLFLNATVAPNPISIAETADIIFKLYLYNGSITDYTSLAKVDLTLNSNGKLDKNVVGLDEKVIYTPTSPGTDSITATIGNVTCTKTLTVTTDGTTFWDLNQTINGNTNDTITLNNNYTYNSASDSAFTEGIIINRPVTINGNGHKIDGKNLARIFHITGSNVTLTNITFTNGKITGYGGAIYWTGDNGTVIGCAFTNNKAEGDYPNGQGGAICWTGANGTVTNTSFSNNTANIGGGAILWFGANGAVTDTTFSNNTATYQGGAISWGGDNGAVTNTSFSNNTANLGGAIYWDGNNGAVTNTSFSNNTANYDGGAIECWGDNGRVTSSIFINNTAKKGNGGAIDWWWNNDGCVSSCYFVKNNGPNTVHYINSDSCVINDNIFLSNNGTEIFSDSSSVDMDCNWFGNNATNYNETPASAVDTWLFLNATANPDNPSVFSTSDIIFKLYLYNSTSQKISEYNNSRLKDINLTITSTKGVTDKNASELADTVKYTAKQGGAGTITATVEDAIYTIELNNIKLSPEFSVNSEDVTYLENATLTLKYNPNANGTVNITLKGKKKNYTFNNIDLNNTIKLENINSDEYSVTVTYSGSDQFFNATANTTLTINKANSTLTINDNVTFDYNTNGSTTVSYTNATGVNASVVGQPNAIVVINDTTITVSGLNAGNYTLTVTTITDANHNNITKNATITVNKAKTQLTANAITTTYNINKDLVITLKDANGNALSGVNVIVDLNGAKTLTTDKNGQVKVSTKGLAPKAYTAKIAFNGNTNYIKSTNDVKVTVKKATPKLAAKKKTFKTTVKTKKYTVVLKDNTGKAIKKAKVTLKVKGKTYKATTNSKGKATFKITKLNKKGTFKATITYKGNKYFNKVSKKAKIKVIVTFKTVSKGSKDKATVKEIQQALKDKGYYLTYQGHYLKVDGKFQSCTERSVKEFQHDKGLKVTGKVDEKTAKKLGII